MSKRVISFAAALVAFALLPRVYLTAVAAIQLFPIKEGNVVFLDLDWAIWLRAAFVAAHACVAACMFLIWKRNATLSVKVMTVILLSEVVAIYLITIRFWQNGVEVPLY